MPSWIYFVFARPGSDTWQMLAFSSRSVLISGTYIYKRVGETCGAICQRLPLPLVITVITKARLQLSYLCATRQSQRQPTNGFGTCNHPILLKSGEYAKKCSTRPLNNFCSVEQKVRVVQLNLYMSFLTDF